MLSDPKAVVVRWFEEVWNNNRDETIDELLAPDAIGHGLGETDQDLQGPSGFRIFSRGIRQALPDVRIDIEDVVVEKNKVAARVLLTGTHQGSGFGVEPSGNRVRIRGIVLIDIKDGQIVHGWNSWDQLGFLRQIGALPGLRTADRFASVPNPQSAEATRA